MPTYEYRCANGHDFEEFYLRMSAAKTELPCPTCGLPGGRRMSAGGGLLFKGSGFYITDYGKDGKKAATTARDSAGKGEGASSGGATGDSAKAAAPTTESAKSDSSKSGSSKSDTTKASAPVASPPKGGE